MNPHNDPTDEFDAVITISWGETRDRRELERVMEVARQAVEGIFQTCCPEGVVAFDAVEYSIEYRDRDTAKEGDA